MESSPAAQGSQKWQLQARETIRQAHFIDACYPQMLAAVAHSDLRSDLQACTCCESSCSESLEQKGPLPAGSGNHAMHVTPKKGGAGKHGWGR